MKQSVLILGSCGMLGQELVRLYESDTDIMLHAWDKDELDVTDEKTCAQKIIDLWPDVIYNAIAYNAVDACQNDPIEQDKARYLNTSFPGKLAEIAGSLQSTLVHYSTDYVFDGKKPRYRSGNAPGCCGKGCNGCSYKGPGETFDGYRENDLPNPLSFYGKTKYEGERLVEKNMTDFYIIRLSKLFGKPALGEGAKKSFFQIMLDKGRQSNDSVDVVSNEIGCFTYAPDLARASRELLADSMEAGIYHLTNQNPASWYESVCELYRLADIKTLVRPISSSEFPRPAPRPHYSTLINKKARPLRPYEEALEEFVKQSLI